MWLFEVGITVKCGQGIVDFCIVVCDTISSYPREWVLGLYVGHWTVVFTCRLVVERFNCKRPLYSVTANCVCKNCLCRGGREELQTKESDTAQKIAYHRRTPKISGRRYRIAPNFHGTKFSQIGLLNFRGNIFRGWKSPVSHAYLWQLHALFVITVATTPCSASCFQIQALLLRSELRLEPS